MYAEYPLGDHDKEEKKELISIESRIESRFSGHLLDFKTRSRYPTSPILDLEPTIRSYSLGITGRGTVFSITRPKPKSHKSPSTLHKSVTVHANKQKLHPKSASADPKSRTLRAASRSGRV